MHRFFMGDLRAATSSPESMCLRLRASASPSASCKPRDAMCWRWCRRACLVQGLQAAWSASPALGRVPCPASEPTPHSLGCSRAMDKQSRCSGCWRTASLRNRGLLQGQVPEHTSDQRSELPCIAADSKEDLL